MPNLAVAFDLDGTFLNNDRKASRDDFNTLVKLGEQGVVRIVATGRNLLSLSRVIDIDYPVDYAVFSSGAGIINWKTKEIIYSKHLNIDDTHRVIDELNKLNLSFLVKESIPDSHNMHFYFYDSSENDLLNYMSHYSDYSRPLNFNAIPKNATQIIALIDNQKHLFNVFKNRLPEIKTILTTSPINKSSMWLEFFNIEVSKANGILYILQLHNIGVQDVMTIGNDYNDTDMLSEFTNSYVVSNAPHELKEKYKIVPSNCESGFSFAVDDFCKLYGY